MPSLPDIPDIALKNILGNCDFRSILALRKTCHRLRNFIISTKPESHITVIRIIPKPEAISLVLKFGDSEQEISTQYHKNERGCVVTWDPIKSKLVKNENFISVFMRDLEIALEHQKSTPLRFFQMMLLCGVPAGFFEKLKNLLESRPQKVHNAYLRVETDEEILSILPFLDPDVLKILDISSSKNEEEPYLDLAEISELEQWKKAKELVINCVLRGVPVQKMLHFLNVHISLERITMEDVSVLKEALTRSPEFDIFEIRLLENGLEGALIEKYGDSYQDIDEEEKPRKQWFFEMQNSENTFSIVYYDEYIIFENLKPVYVPTDAVILI
ncbi:hypothetical protein CRE_23448 [Caenorhabditis remanei]|uniref:F-box domain-containing protein n=1 Tax=Caenorhabditis remanei TaxID=31234 RepID=E3MGT1_CAERE|nr:hypothetical protein CRE_23448 [Caenorhabditis remanei]